MVKVNLLRKRDNLSGLKAFVYVNQRKLRTILVFAWNMAFWQKITTPNRKSTMWDYIFQVFQM